MRWLIRILAVGAVALALSGFAVAQDTAPGKPEVAPPDQTVAVDPVARDGQIERRIARILTATGWYRDLRVQVTEGVVFLDGDTDGGEHRTWARDLAAKTQDVVAVVNRITVTPVMNWTFRPALAKLTELLRTGIATLPLLVIALVIMPLAAYASILVARVGDWLFENRLASPFLRRVLARAIAVPVFLVGLYVVLQVAGLTQLALSVLGGAGVFGIIVGFAFRDIAENFLASLLLSMRQPFRRGDYIQVGAYEGTVLSMNSRSTLLLSNEGNHIQIPNAAIFKGTIVNFTAAPARREMLEVGIGYDASIPRAQQIILEVLESHDAVLNEPEEPLVLVDSLGSSTVNLRAYFWFDGRAYSVLRVRSALLRLVKQALEDNAISMPDAAREVIFPEGVPLLDRRAPGAPPRTEASPAAQPAEEAGQSATEAEGGLTSEQQSLERHGANVDIPEVTRSDDLLGRPPK